MLVRRVSAVAVVAAMVAVTGCGGGGADTDSTRPSAGTSSTTTTPAPAVYDLAALKAARTEKSSDSSGDEGLLVATVTLVSGTTTAGAFVSLSASGCAPDAAVDLADRLVRDYLDRLPG